MSSANKKPDALSTATASGDVREMLSKAQEIMRLFQDAIELGYLIEFTPEQWQALITICEAGYLVKQKREES